MKLALRVFTVSSVFCGAVGRPTPSPRVHRDVNTSQGAVRGYLAPDPPHFAYFGLPYARSPIRHDRFKAPKPPHQWDGVFEATHKIKCPQPNADGEENCLVVNVFTPELATSLPVLVFVHGGDFQHGWGAYQPPARFLTEGFVIVTFNYRLGALGFLCLNITEAPGNAGLKDQIAALYWVHRNIAQFGGNPRDVTVYGTGSGSASVQLVLLSGLAKGFLHRVILESGSVLSPSTMSYDSLSVAYKGAISLGYEETDEPEELYKFFQETSAEDMVRMPNTFLPCVENESEHTHTLIDIDPLKRLKDGNFDKVPMLITFTHKDISIFREITDRVNIVPENFENMLPHNLEFDDRKIKQGVAEIVKQFYFGEGSGNGNVAQGYIEYIHDIFTEYPIMKMAVLFAAKNIYSVYVMRLILPREGETPEDAASKSSDTLLDYLYKGDAQTDEYVLEKLMTLLKNFIQFGDPTPLMTTVIPLIWQPIDPFTAVHKDISDIPILQFHTNMKMAISPMNQRLLFWDNIYSKFYKPYVVEQKECDDCDDTE